MMLAFDSRLTGAVELNVWRRPLIALAIALVAAGCDRQEDTLFDRVDRGDLGGVARLLAEGVPVDTADPGGFTALHKSLSRHQPEIARYLIEHGADVAMQAAYGVAPLHLVEDARTARMLIARGAPLDTWSKSRASPLHSAVQRDLPEVVRVLVEAGADLESRDVNGSRPLHYAAGKGLGEIAALLMDAGAEPDSVNAFGFTPLHWAAGNGHEEMVALLLADGASPAPRSADGVTPHDMAMAKGHEAVAHRLETASGQR